eukprot:CAMPEP_0117072346 /NCGR_PEP_ID=MMETSP0472-20121206/50922_1 /TAXON_ID=693140 ORGANISM="Tiarina fusus, Strain LIS" /NCGR_SAMPLE_ID=MMETSP0472 /ASSEMBLY_ACC=CAM_ASM_000603 /LENGTH=183 /DNA_ID=CAMNT_0004796415 /DNA_START=54 /DNA_END=603 /DNA_ORIENTATION=-
MGVRSKYPSVDPTQLPPGVHTAKVCGTDAEHPERGILWSLPITAVKPLPQNRGVSLGMLEFRPAEVKRFFVVPPPGATWMDISIKDGRDSSDGASNCLYVLHTIQLIPHAAYRDYAQQKYLNLSPSKPAFEIDIGRYWSAAGVAKVEASIEFRGVQPIPSTFSMNSGDTFVFVRAHSELTDEY